MLIMINLPLIGFILFFLTFQSLVAPSKNIFDHNLDGKEDIEPIKRRYDYKKYHNHELNEYIKSDKFI